MKITLLYQVFGFSLYQGKKTKKYKELGLAKLPRYKEDFVISDLVITRFHCTCILLYKSITLDYIDNETSKVTFLAWIRY